MVIQDIAQDKPRNIPNADTTRNIYSTVGRSIADRYIRHEVNMLPRLDIEVIDRPIVLYILYSTISVQQTNLLPENASQKNTVFPKSRYGIYQTISQCLSSYGCAIIVLYIVIHRPHKRFALFSGMWAQYVSTTAHINKVLYKEVPAPVRLIYDVGLINWSPDHWTQPQKLPSFESNFYSLLTCLMALELL